MRDQIFQRSGREGFDDDGPDVDLDLAGNGQLRGAGQAEAQGVGARQVVEQVDDRDAFLCGAVDDGLGDGRAWAGLAVDGARGEETPNWLGLPEVIGEGDIAGVPSLRAVPGR